MKAPEKYRVISHPTMGTLPSDGANGAFLIPLPNQGEHPDVFALCLASDGSVAPMMDQWEHVSVSIRHTGLKETRIPTWEEMCWVKSIFWNDDETVVQFHPARERYVNNHPSVLHMWRSLTYRQPMPPMDFV